MSGLCCCSAIRVGQRNRPDVLRPHEGLSSGRRLFSCADRVPHERLVFRLVVLDSSCAVARAVYFRCRRHRKGFPSQGPLSQGFTPPNEGDWWSRGGSNS